MKLPSSPLVRDCLLAAVLTVAAQVELFVAADQVENRLAQHMVFLPMTASTAMRRRAPVSAAVVLGAAMAVQTFAGTAPVVSGFLAMLVVLVSLGFYTSLRRGLVGVAAVAAGALTYDLVTDDFRLGDLVANAVIVIGAWALAFVWRQSTDAWVAAELTRDRAAREAVEEERSRIARDLHDSVAHALTLMTLQAGAARERSSDPVSVDALAAIETGGRQALVDMHRFLRLLVDEGSPGQTPGLQDLDDLLARLRSGGFAVELETTGDLATLPTSVSSTAYRVVQEGLTNAAKHSGAAQVKVTIRHDGDELVVEVTDRGRDAADGRDLSIGSGRGLASLRDRLALFDGSLSAAPEDGGWALRAVIPVGSAP